MLGERDEAMSWPAQKVVNIAKQSDDQVQRDIGVTIQAEQAILMKSVQEFQARGLITPEEDSTPPAQTFRRNSILWFAQSHGIEARERRRIIR